MTKQKDFQTLHTTQKQEGACLRFNEWRPKVAGLEYVLRKLGQSETPCIPFQLTKKLKETTSCVFAASTQDMFDA